MRTAFTELFHLNYSVVHLISKNFYYLVPSMDSQGTQHQAVTCGHTQYGKYSVIQRLWLVSAFLHLDKEVASKTRTAHTAVRFPAKL